MTAGTRFFSQNMPTRTVAGRFASGAGPVEALDLTLLAEQLALALINNAIPQSPSVPATWGELVGAIEGAQSWTIGSSIIYTAAAGGFFTATTGGGVTYLRALSFYNGVLWANEQSGGNPDVLDVLNFTAGGLVYQHDYSAFREILGAINQQSEPPGLVALQPTTPDGNMYFVAFDGGVFSFAAGGIALSLLRVDQEDSAGAIYVEYLNSSHRIRKYTSVDFAAHTATLSGDLQDPGNLAFNSCCIDSRCYIRISNDAIGWLHTTTDVLTTLKTFANACSVPLIGGRFGGASDTAIFVQSGDTNHANRLQRRTLDGVLVSEATLSSIGTTAYATITMMAYDYVNDHVWVQSGVGLHCVQASAMVELAFLATASLACQLIQPVGHPSGGAFAFTDQSGSYYTTVSRLSITAS